LEKAKPKITNFDLWLDITEIRHFMFIVRQREISSYGIPLQQLHVLRTIHALGEKADTSAIAKEVERNIDVISRQLVKMERDGLITRVKARPKSRLLRIQLTEKGNELLNISNQSDEIDAALSFLTDEERVRIHAVLSKMLANLKEQAAEQ
jgi:DNA-binding MarR family transcriptional regulator